MKSFNWSVVSFDWNLICLTIIRFLDFVRFGINVYIYRGIDCLVNCRSSIKDKYWPMLVQNRNNGELSYLECESSWHYQCQGQSPRVRSLRIEIAIGAIISASGSRQRRQTQLTIVQFIWRKIYNHCYGSAYEINRNIWLWTLNVRVKVTFAFNS